MATLTTQQAVKRLLTSEDYLALWLQSGYTKAYRRKLRYRLRKQGLSKNLQEELLGNCGFRVAVEKAWMFDRFLL